ncbi:hypothetical protein ARMGADRAFT_944798, partial [Armillaria gallica]
NAKSNSATEKLFNKSGIRWSPLYLLPYFDLSCMIIIDSMHNLFLGLLKEHFRRILGFCVKTKRDKAMSGAVNIDIPDDTHIPLEDKHIKSVKSIKRLLEQPLAEVFSNAQELYKFENKLVAKSHPALFYIANRLSCLDFDISQSIEARDRWMKGLKKRHKIPTNSGKPNRVSGSEGHGKLKADQWRTLGLTYMPISLIRLWAESTEAPERCALLELTMNLVTAIIIATSYETSQENSEAYTHYMIQYRSGLRKLFADYHCHPNHHMALHIGEYLCMYGPVQGWWTFPFERAIGMLERISTNYKAGELRVYFLLPVLTRA